MCTMSDVGTAVSIHQSKQNMKYQRKILANQASMERSRAAVTEQNAGIQRMRLAEQRRQETASGLTDFAANGIQIDGEVNSAPNMWEQDMAAETAWQQEEIRSNAMYEIWGYSENAKALGAQRGIAKRNFQYNTVSAVAGNANANGQSATSIISMGKSMGS